MAHGTSVHHDGDRIGTPRSSRTRTDRSSHDHRNFGDSGGEPRQEINPWRLAGTETP
jgi:hypothetical protein